MKIEFDPQADAAYLELIEGTVERSENNWGQSKIKFLL